MRALRPLVLIGIGGMFYVLIEILFRGHSHWTMFLLGGFCFWWIGMINEAIPWDMALWKQAIIGGLYITVMEFLMGCIANLWLGWDIWDYSDMPFNLLGQICLPFSIAWVGLALVAIILDDYLRYWLFGEEKPHYKFW